MGPADARASSELSGVSAVAPDDVWAVGVTVPSSGPARTLVERWRDAAWHSVPSPDRRPGGSFLNAVVALSASNAWAVGQSRSPGRPTRTLVLHWDGRRWAIVASPNAGSGDNSLVSVAAASSRDVWAAGYSTAGPVFRALVEHWNGARWTQERLPRLAGAGNALNAIDAASPGVVWAVGGSAKPRGPTQPLVLRLAGKKWLAVAAPASMHSATLVGVAAWDGTGAWVVGSTRSGGGDRSFGLRTDGQGWRVVPSVPTAALSVDLNAAWAAAPRDVWAVGSSFDGRWFRPLVEHAARGRLSSVRVPRLPGYDARLMAVDGLAAGEIWAVGNASRSGGHQRILILLRCASSRS
jgi:hypothetical protein